MLQLLVEAGLAVVGYKLAKRAIRKSPELQLACNDIKSAVQSVGIELHNSVQKLEKAQNVDKRSEYMKALEQLRG